MAEQDDEELERQAAEIVAKRAKKLDQWREQMAEQGIPVSDDMLAEMLTQPTLTRDDIIPAFGRGRRGTK